MPSFKETFVVVYLEALSQGLPVIHSREQGVDGLFQPGTVSEAVEPKSVHDIARSVETLAKRVDRIRPACIREAQKFGWDSIASRYGDIYRGYFST